MLYLISPAKNLDFETPATTKKFTQPELMEHAQELAQVCVDLTPQDLSSLMGISDKLAGLNAARFAEWHPNFTPDNAKQAVLAFNGDVYTGLQATEFNQAELDYAQTHLRILSGLYGLLRPLDLMQAYRLEMGTQLKVGRKKNLYEFWKKDITEALNNELDEGELFINLASNEYFGAIDTKKLKVPVIAPVFKDWKNDKLKIISFFAKKARGSMVRYILDTDAKTLEDIKGFNYDGYMFSQEHTTKPNEPVFIR